jgi:hypothetical protein
MSDPRPRNRGRIDERPPRTTRAPATIMQFRSWASLSRSPASLNLALCYCKSGAPRIEVQAHAVRTSRQEAGPNRFCHRGSGQARRTDAALLAIDSQRRTHQVLARGRQGASALTDLKADHVTLGANGRQIEVGGRPYPPSRRADQRHTDSEWAMRWLLALLVRCCDLLAVAPKAAASAGNRSQSNTALRKIMDDVLQVAD